MTKEHAYAYESGYKDGYAARDGEIVRCRDCKHYRPHEFVLITDIEHVCLFWAEGVKVAPDGYCAWGERRNDEG